MTSATVMVFVSKAVLHVDKLPLLALALALALSVLSTVYRSFYKSVEKRTKGMGGVAGCVKGVI